jgi:hypothetical protein
MLNLRPRSRSDTPDELIPKSLHASLNTSCHNEPTIHIVNSG